MSRRNKTTAIAPVNTQIATTQEPRSILDVIAGVASDPSVSTEKMTALLVLQKEIMAMEAEKSFNVSLAALQAEMPPITKRGKVDFTTPKGRTNYAYERYEDIDAIIRPLTSKYGFSFSCIETEEPGRYMGTLLHKDGHSKSGFCTLPADKTGNKNDIQAIGSANSYARRMILKGLLNIVTIGEDDDAQTFSYITPVQVNQIVERIVSDEIDKERFLKQIGIDAIEHIPITMFESVIRAINERAAKKAQKKAVQFPDEETNGLDVNDIFADGKAMGD